MCRGACWLGVSFLGALGGDSMLLGCARGGEPGGVLGGLMQGAPSLLASKNRDPSLMFERELVAACGRGTPALLVFENTSSEWTPRTAS